MLFLYNLSAFGRDLVRFFVTNFHVISYVMISKGIQFLYLNKCSLLHWNKKYHEKTLGFKSNYVTGLLTNLWESNSAGWQLGSIFSTLKRSDISQLRKGTHKFVLYCYKFVINYISFRKAINMNTIKQIWYRKSKWMLLRKYTHIFNSLFIKLLTRTESLILLSNYNFLLLLKIIKLHIIHKCT